MREEWITNLSHDLRTPLSSIKGYGEVLAEPDEAMPAEEREKYAGIIVGKADYMGALLDDLKITYQLKNELLPLKKQEGNIVELIRSVVIELLNNPRYEERDIEFETTAEYIPFLFDSVWLQRAFMNIIYNAIVHNPPGTKVRVSVRGNGEQITVEIEDDGKGIEEQELANVFERYYRGTNTEGQHEGSGLGMAIARQIITAHQGEITVKSEIGAGTKVVIVF
ncbi:sensor histidine kinase [Aneurinibacillus tyrosinisolvens]|uniref:sensor histidine kinase n=1 Tax=Aneurinibacillus tyrosinisolvens TaxID=1443435 RepID=UPI000699C126|nr:HAMP domain-containing sensor histidine kinase [Aneurinibacillus tyrosinisolvens]